MRAPVALRIREGREWSVVEGNDGRVGFKRGKGEEGNGQGWFRKLLVTEGSGGKVREVGAGQKKALGSWRMSSWFLHSASIDCMPTVCINNGRQSLT